MKDFYDLFLHCLGCPFSVQLYDHSRRDWQIIGYFPTLKAAQMMHDLLDKDYLVIITEIDPHKGVDIDALLSAKKSSSEERQ